MEQHEVEDIVETLFPLISADMTSRVDRALPPIMVRLELVEARALERGEKGAAGTDGAPGQPGLDGKDGAAGRDGIDGASGRDGLDGKDGAPGLDGKDGAAGRDGIDGGPGAIGPVGDKGDKGDSGDVGPVGPVGARGDDADPVSIDEISTAIRAMPEFHAIIVATVEKHLVANPPPNGVQGESGRDGRDGFSLSDFDTEVKDGGKTLLLKFGSGDTEEIHELDFSGLAGKDGRDIDPVNVAAVIDDAVARAMAAVPRPQDGKSVTLDDVRPLIDAAVGKIPLPRDGRDADPSVMKTMVDEIIARALIDHEISVPDDLAGQVAKSIATLAESPSIVAKAQGQPIVVNVTTGGGPERTRNKTITARKDKDGNLVADVIERLE